MIGFYKSSMMMDTSAPRNSSRLSSCLWQSDPLPLESPLITNSTMPRSNIL